MCVFYTHTDFKIGLNRACYMFSEPKLAVLAKSDLIGAQRGPIRGVPGPKFFFLVVVVVFQEITGKVCFRPPGVVFMPFLTGKVRKSYFF